MGRRAEGIPDLYTLGARLERKKGTGYFCVPGAKLRVEIGGLLFLNIFFS